MGLELTWSAASLGELEPRGPVVLARLSAPPAESVVREPLQLALLLDRSSSMSGAPLDAALRAASELVARLGPADRLTLIAFDGMARVLADGLEMDEAARRSVSAELARLVPGAGTHLEAALRVGYESLGKRLVRRAQPHVLLLTDGEPSVGSRDPAQLVRRVAEARKAGITTSAAGLGSAYDDALLASFAREGEGTFHHVPHPDAIASVLMREVDGVSHPTARDVALYLQLDEAVASAELVQRLPTQHKGGALRIQVGEVCAGQSRDVLLVCEGGSGRVGAVRASWSEVDGGSALRPPEELRCTANAAEVREVAAAWLGFRVGEVLDRAWHLTVTDRREQALELLAAFEATLASATVRHAGEQQFAPLGARLAACRELTARADADRAELEAARRRDREFTERSRVSRVFVHRKGEE